MALPTACLSPVASLIAAACALALATGCRNLDNVQTDLMERELRQQEDYIYELEDCLMQYSEKLREARMMCGPETIAVSSPSTTSKTIGGGARRPLIEPELVEDPPRRAPPATAPTRRTPAPSATPRTAPIATPPEIDEPPADLDPPPATEPSGQPLELDELEPPELEIGPTTQAEPLPWLGESPELPLGEAPPYAVAAASIPDPAAFEQVGELATGDAAVNALAAETAPPGDGPALLAPSATDRHTPSELAICRLLASPAADAASPGSLLTVVEVHGAAGEPLDAAGSASLMIMQGESTATLTRIHRWDFTLEETATAWQSSALGDGLHLELPLDGVELPAGKLELWARLVTADGQKLLTRVPFSQDQLVSFDDADLEPAEMAALEPIPAPENRAAYDEAAAAPLTATSVETEVTTATASAPTGGGWRRATKHVGPRVEGFGTTATGASSTAGGWTVRSNASATTLR